MVHRVDFIGFEKRKGLLHRGKQGQKHVLDVFGSEAGLQCDVDELFSMDEMEHVRKQGILQQGGKNDSF